MTVPSQICFFSKALHGAVTPTLDFQFARNRALDSRITFTRSGAGGSFNSSGTIISNSSGTPRFDYDPLTLKSLGFLQELPATNLLLRSEDFANATWVKTNSTCTSNTTTAPDGNSTADKLVEDSTASSVHQFEQSVTTVASTTYTGSLFVKMGERVNIELRCYSSTDGFFAVFNAQTGAITTSGATGTGSLAQTSVQELLNGWVRFSATGVISTSGTTSFFRLRLYNGSTTYSGDGSSGLYLWGAQLETRQLATTYITTTSAQVTRPADVASMAVNSSWFNPNNGTFIAEACFPGSASAISRYYYTATVSGGADRIAQFVSTNVLASRYTVANTATPPGNSAAFSLNSFNKVAMSYSSASANAIINGGSITTASASASPTTIDTFYIGGSSGGEQPQGWSKTLQYFNTNLSSDQITASTTYQYAPVYRISGLIDGTLDASLTFTRAGSARCYNSSGTLVTKSTDVVRWDYDPDTLTLRGILLEESKTNICLQSEDFSTTWATTVATVTTNATTAPDGNSTADKLAEASGTTTHRITQTIAVTNTNPYAASVFIKAAERGYALVLTGGSLPTNGISVNLSTGAVSTATGSPTDTYAQKLPNGWVRVGLVGTATSTGNATFDIYCSTDGVYANRTYAGSAGSGIYVWGAQLELGSGVTSYIPTTTASVTRAADVLTNSSISSWFNRYVGTMFVEVMVPSVKTIGSQYRLWAMIDDSSNSANSRVTLRGNSAGSLYAANVTRQGVAMLNLGYGSAPTINTVLRQAVAYKNQDCNAAGGGTLGTLSTSPALSVALNRLQIGISATESNSGMNGWFRGLTFWDERCQDNFIKTITGSSATF